MAEACTGVCVLCEKQVTEEDHRREIDCPSKTCPGRVYHEDCIAGYLRRTKYSKDRCTGFPCPAMLATGKQCPGYVCKMHTYFPINQKKKAARVAAAAQTAAVPAKSKPPLAPVPKPKTGAQVAMAAMKQGTTGAPQPVAVRMAKPLGVVNTHTANAAGQAAPRFIPGFNGPIQDAAALRQEVANLRAGGKSPAMANKNNAANVRAVGGGKGKAGNAAWPATRAKEEEEEEVERQPKGATLWDAYVKPGWSADDGGLGAGNGSDLNIYALEQHAKRNGGGGGQFSALLKRRLDKAKDGGDGSAWGMDGGLTGFVNDGTSSECDSTTYSDRDGYESGFQLSNATSVMSPSALGALGGDGFPALPTKDPTPKAPHTLSNDAQSDGHGHGSLVKQLGAVADIDPVLEYDMLYSADDGNGYCVLEPISNAFYRLEDVYGAVEMALAEVAGEDGNVYTCVAVTQSMMEARGEMARRWLEAQEAAELAAAEAAKAEAHAAAEAAAAQLIAQQLQQQQVVRSASEMLFAGGALPEGVAVWGGAAVPVPAPVRNPYGNSGIEYGVPAKNAATAAGDDDTDVDSLMALLCV